MERKIGEIFEYNGEWYQCLESNSYHCDYCDYLGECNKIACTSGERSDDKEVCFKKLEKVGEPYEFDGHLFQSYRTFEVPIFTENYATVRELGNNSKISIEIKQTKEDMEEKKQKWGVSSDTINEINKGIETMNTSRNIDTERSGAEGIRGNLKPFNLEAAKQGKPICTRDGRKARIICFDRVGDFPIVALTDDRDYKEEGVNLYDINGKGSNECFDLMMLPEKKEGWVNVYYDNDASSHRGCRFIYDTKERAVKEAGSSYITTVKINWEE